MDLSHQRHVSEGRFDMRLDGILLFCNLLKKT